MKDSLTLLSQLSVTAGALSLVFIVFCVEQLTSLSRRAEEASKGEYEETARFHTAKYLTALIVGAFTTLAFLGSGVLAVLRLEHTVVEPLSLDIATGYWLFAYGCVCLIVLVVSFVIFELRSYRK